jgi:glycosyltransferase involved in cell wall biosynthesis
MLRKAVEEFAPSVVHSFSRLAYLAPLLLRRLPKLMSYQRPTGGGQTRVAALLGGKSLVYTGCSEFIAGMGRAHGGAWHAVPNFVDVEAFPFSQRVSGDAPLVFLSRIESIKGAHIAIEVAKKCGRRLLVAGNHAAGGPEREYWTARIKPELGRNGIDYVGPVDDRAKMELLGSAAAMIVPIQWDEPFGIVFAEALACGTPVISCPRGALPEIVRDGVDGFLVRDAEEACRAVAGISAIDRRQCRARAEQAFSAAAVVPRYEALYRALVEQV